MTVTYQIVETQYMGQTIQTFSKFIDGVMVMSIPKSTDNTDYQMYLEWLAEGNTPDPAE